MSIHYQSTVELAGSELLDTPLKDAIGAINIPRRRTDGLVGFR